MKPTTRPNTTADDLFTAQHTDATDNDESDLCFVIELDEASLSYVAGGYRKPPIKF